MIFILAILVDVPTWMWENSQFHILRSRAIDNQWVLREEESAFSRDKYIYEQY